MFQIAKHLVYDYFRRRAGPKAHGLHERQQQRALHAH
ncbi:hypothetical protein DU508_16880 [Pedobacter chinensis]|uniref:Uncharacterized protein n=1 Tax=Pedobacter chinensis TaxID=2282421 RepID=A0A369PS13_9SPHI|nr:hypothetical protein DU508_16880 [Pedobacter chinensis]